MDCRSHDITKHTVTVTKRIVEVVTYNNRVTEKCVKFEKNRLMTAPGILTHDRECPIPIIS